VLPLSGERHPVRDRQHRDRDPLVGREAVVQPAQAQRVSVLLGVVGDAAAPEDVVVGDEAASPTTLSRTLTRWACAG